MNNLEKLLRKVEKPGRYIGGEWNSIAKNSKEVKTRFAFAFPDIYEIGMSFVGLQILYHMLNREEDIYCERVFAPAKDMETIMREEGVPLFSLETKTPLKEFDMVGFTLQYEMSYTNILNMLQLGKIPLRREDRDEEDPLVMAGGPCAFNPEPLADFFDLFIVGDGEESLPQVVKLYGESSSKIQFLKRAVDIEGVYVPQFYDPIYREDGTILRYDKLYEGAPDRVKRSLVHSLEDIPYPRNPIVPLIEIAQDRAVVETFRGCTRGCRFCQAGMIYRPVRERTPETVKKLAAAQLKASGHDELSLLSLSTSDYSRFRELAMDLIAVCREKDVALSLPSLRLDSFSFEVLSEIQKYRKTGLTFAPEAGTQRLRDIINKNITEEDILHAMEQAIRLGWKRVKLYFMMGLPGETMEDLEGIANIAKKIMDLNFQIMGRAGGRFQLSVSVSNFVPKPHTPFQWSSQEEDFIEKHDFLTKRLKIKGVSFHYHDSFISILEGLFARGDRKTGAIIEKALESGCTFDGWSEHFNEEGWRRALSETGIDLHFYTARRRNYDEVFPWDIIDSGIRKEYLVEEMEKAKKGITTPDCREGCRDCGINHRTTCTMEGING